MKPDIDARSLASSLGIALRIAQRIGINDESTNSKCSTLDAELRRRTMVVARHLRQSNVRDVQHSQVDHVAAHLGLQATNQRQRLRLASRDPESTERRRCAEPGNLHRSPDANRRLLAAQRLLPQLQPSSPEIRGQSATKSRRLRRTDRNPLPPEMQPRRPSSFHDYVDGSRLTGQEPILGAHFQVPGTLHQTNGCPAGHGCLSRPAVP